MQTYVHRTRQYAIAAFSRFARVDAVELVHFAIRINARPSPCTWPTAALMSLWLSTA